MTTLFAPLVRNAETASLDVKTKDIFPIMRRLLEHPSCRGIMTHVRETKEGIDRLFASDGFPTDHLHQSALRSRSLEHAPDVLTERKPDAPMRLFFNNSWHGEDATSRQGRPVRAQGMRAALPRRRRCISH